MLQFVPVEQIDPIYFAKSYYLEPEKNAVKPYVLLRDALEESGKVGLVKVAIRNREQLATLRVRDGVIVMETMIWPDEVRDADFGFLDEDIDLRPQEQPDGRVAASRAWPATSTRSEYTDDYREALQEVIDAKIEGREVVETEEAQPTAGNVVDLMSALRASVEAAKRGRGEAARRSAGGDAGGREEGGARRRPQGAGQEGRRRRPGEEDGRRQEGAARSAAGEEAAARQPPEAARRRRRSAAAVRHRPAHCRAACARADDGQTVRRSTSVDVRVHVRTTPPHGAEPALFVHGLGGSAPNWTDFAAVLRDHLAVEAIDLPGHGRSGPAPRSGLHPRCARPHGHRLPRAVRPRAGAPGRQLDGRRGHRSSSTARRPDLVRTLTLISPAVPDTKKLRVHALRGDPRMALLILPGLGSAAMRRMSALPVETRVKAHDRDVFADPKRFPAERLAEAISEAEARQDMPWANKAFLRSLRGLVRSQFLQRGQGMDADARRSRRPRSLCGATQDRLVAPDLAPSVAAAVPDSRLLVLEDVGHTAMMEEPAITARAMLAWSRRRLRPRRRPGADGPADGLRPATIRRRLCDAPATMPGTPGCMSAPRAVRIACRRRASTTTSAVTRRRRQPPSAVRPRSPALRRPVARLRASLRLACLRAAAARRHHRRRAAHATGASKHAHRNRSRRAGRTAPRPPDRPLAVASIALKSDAARSERVRTPFCPRPPCPAVPRTPRRAPARSGCCPERAR